MELQSKLKAADKLAHNIAGKLGNWIAQGTDEEYVTLNLCIELAKRERRKNSNVNYFFLSTAPGGTEESMDVRLAFLDGGCQPVSLDGTAANCYVFRTKVGNIDKKIFDLLNGKPSVMVQM